MASNALSCAGYRRAEIYSKKGEGYNALEYDSECSDLDKVDLYQVAL